MNLVVVIHVSHFKVRCFACGHTAQLPAACSEHGGLLQPWALSHRDPRLTGLLGTVNGEPLTPCDFDVAHLLR